MALMTQNDLEQHLQITFGTQPSDPVVATLIDQAQAAADRWCQVALEEQAGVVEKFEVDQWEPWHRLSGFPVSAVTLVTVDGENLIADQDYVWYPDGRIRRILNSDDRSWSRLVNGNEVTYTYGYQAGSAPDDLVLGITLICAELFRTGAQFASTGTSGPVQTVQLDGSDSVTYATGTYTVQPAQGGVFIPPAAKQLLGPYARRRL